MYGSGQPYSLHRITHRVVCTETCAGSATPLNCSHARSEALGRSCEQCSVYWTRVYAHNCTLDLVSLEKSHTQSHTCFGLYSSHAHRSSTLGTPLNKCRTQSSTHTHTHTSRPVQQSCTPQFYIDYALNKCRTQSHTHTFWYAQQPCTPQLYSDFTLELNHTQSHATFWDVRQSCDDNSSKHQCI